MSDSESSAASVEVLSRKDARKRAKGIKAGVVPEVAPPPRSQFSVWIGNLNWKTTEDALKSWLSARLVAHKGKITRVHMPPGKAAHDNNKGFAYVDFDTESLMLEAVKLSEDNLEGRKLLIKRGDDFGGRPAVKASSSVLAQVVALLPAGYATQNYADSGLSKVEKQIAEKQKNAPCPTLFLGNLPFEATEETIMQMFEKHHTAVGELEKAGIKRVRLGTFEDTGKCKGWAFVDFDSPTLATLALLNTRNHKMQDKPLKIEFATEDAVRRGANFRPPRPEKAADKKKARRERDRVVPPRTKAAPMGQKRLLDGEVADAPKGKKIKFEEEDPVVEVVGTLEGVQMLERPEKKRKAREAEDEEPGEKSKKRKGADGPAAAKPKKRKKEKISED